MEVAIILACLLCRRIACLAGPAYKLALGFREYFVSPRLHLGRDICYNNSSLYRVVVLSPSGISAIPRCRSGF